LYIDVVVVVVVVVVAAATGDIDIELIEVRSFARGMYKR